jgi:ferredoxin
MYRVEVDRSLCSGFGSCAELAPRNLRLGADGLAHVTEPHTDDDAILEAAASCPMGAIAVFEEARRAA